jgi:hypothetical protein
MEGSLFFRGDSITIVLLLNLAAAAGPTQAAQRVHRMLRGFAENIYY